MAWELDVCIRVSLIVTSFDCAKEDGMGSVLDASKTEYWRSHKSKTISAVGDLDTAANRTWEEPKDSSEISSLVCMLEMKERPVRRKVSAADDRMTESPSRDSSWNECHEPSRAREK